VANGELRTESHIDEEIGSRTDTVSTPGGDLGPAANAGLKAGATVTKFDGHVLDDGTDLIALVRKYAPDTTVPISNKNKIKKYAIKKK